MATGIVASLGNSASVTYTPASDAQLMLACAGASTNVTVNSVAAFTGSSSITAANVKLFVAGGVAVTIATGASVTCIVSSLES